MKDNKKEIQDTVNKVRVSFVALDPYDDDQTVRPIEVTQRGRGWVDFGERNAYANYVWELSHKSATLSSIINGIADYTVGNQVSSNSALFSDDELEDIIREIAISYATYGGFAINVLRNRMGQICKLIPLDIRCIRTDEDHTVYYYSKDFRDRTKRGHYSTLMYPKFDPNGKEDNSVFYYRNDRHKTYPTPPFASAIKSVETDILINDFQCNLVRNGLASDYIVSFNNGIPTSEVQDEIEEMFNDKFSGSGNAGRPIISYSEDKEHAPEILAVPDSQFADKWQNVSKRSQQEIFKAYKAQPLLFGQNTDQNGSLSVEQFDMAFKLFNTSEIKPIQKLIKRSFREILGQDVIEIEPFSIDFEGEDDANTTNEGEVK